MSCAKCNIGLKSCLPAASQPGQRYVFIAIIETEPLSVYADAPRSSLEFSQAPTSPLSQRARGAAAVILLVDPRGLLDGVEQSVKPGKSGSTVQHCPLRSAHRRDGHCFKHAVPTDFKSEFVCSACSSAFNPPNLLTNKH